MDKQELKDKSKLELLKRHSGVQLCGSVFLTAAAFGLGGLPAALGALLLSGKRYADWQRQYDDDWDRVGDPNCLQHIDLLPAADIKALERQHGKDAVQQAIKGDKEAIKILLVGSVNVSHTQTTINIQNNYGSTASDRAADSTGDDATTEPAIIQSDRATTADVPAGNGDLALPVTQLQDDTVLQPEQLQQIYAPVQESKRQFEQPTYEVIVSNSHQPVQYTPDDDPTEFDWVDDIRYAPFLLIYGAQGAGKSTVAEWLCYERQGMGHRVDICDPHTHYGQWQGLNVVGAGMEYSKIDAYLKDALSKIKARYQNLATQPNCNFQPVTILLEELTNWEAEVPISGEFARKSWSDFRKAAYCVIMVSHDNTLQATGGAKGVAKAKKSTMLELQLFAQNVPGTTKLQPTGWGELTYPDGRKRKVRIPEWFQNPKIPATENHIVSANNMVSPVPALAQTIIAETIAAESENPEQLVNAQAQANFERIHAEKSSGTPKCPIELTQAILRCQKLLGDKWTQAHLDTMLAPDDNDSYHRCLHRCLTDLDRYIKSGEIVFPDKKGNPLKEFSVGMFCRDVCKKSDEGASRKEAAEYWKWLEHCYGPIRKP